MRVAPQDLQVQPPPMLVVLLAVCMPACSCWHRTIVAHAASVPLTPPLLLAPVLAAQASRPLNYAGPACACAQCRRPHPRPGTGGGPRIQHPHHAPDVKLLSSGGASTPPRQRCSQRGT